MRLEIEGSKCWIQSTRKSRHDEGTLADFVDQYLAYMFRKVTKGAMADGTRNTYGGMLKRTASVIGTASVASIAKVDINQTLSALTSGTVTCRLEILLEIALCARAGACPGGGDPNWYSMELKTQPWRTENGQT